MKSSYRLYSSARGTTPPSYVGMESGFLSPDKSPTKKRNKKAEENDTGKFELSAMKKTRSDIKDTLSNIQSLLSSGKSKNSITSHLKKLMKSLNEVNTDRLSIANGSIDIISEEQKISLLEVYNEEVTKITNEIIELRAKK